jgi:putative acetyltransferase
MAELADLWVASWQEAMPFIDFTARRAWLCRHVPALEAEGALTLCAFGGPGQFGSGQLLGFMVLDVAAGYLDQLAVAPFAKGKGVARRLLSEARRLSPKGLQLDVNIDNPRAVRFYEREDFAAVGEGLAPQSGLRTLKMVWREPASDEKAPEV